MRNVVLAFATAMVVGGCGDNGGSLKLDGGNKDLAGGGGQDGSGSLPDLSGSGGGPKACGAIWDCALVQQKDPTMCAAGKPQVAKDAFGDAVRCMFVTYCGDTGDASAGQKCAAGMLATDAGLSTCDDCINNTIHGMMSFFVDSNGAKIPCNPTNAPECGQCAIPALNCLSQCFTDADCIGFTTPLTCANASGTTPGTCM